VFGSVPRGTSTPESDVDFLVDIPGDVRGFDAFGLLDDMRLDFEAILGYPVDVVTVREPLSPRGAELARVILAEAQDL
jgi:predicted nucleotidyltransferase